MAHFSLIPSSETVELADDIRRLFDELAASLPQHQRAYSGECHPTLDVVETEDTVKVIVDISGVAADALRVLFRGGVLIVAGEKAPAFTSNGQTFHLVEREFGRFARAVRLTGAFDIGGSHATLVAGELTIVLPKLLERRGQAQLIRVTTDRPA